MWSIQCLWYYYCPSVHVGWIGIVTRRCCQNVTWSGVNILDFWIETISVDTHAQFLDYYMSLEFFSSQFSITDQQCSAAYRLICYFFLNSPVVSQYLVSIACLDTAFACGPSIDRRSNSIRDPFGYRFHLFLGVMMVLRSLRSAAALPVFRSRSLWFHLLLKFFKSASYKRSVF